MKKNLSAFYAYKDETYLQLAVYSCVLDSITIIQMLAIQSKTMAEMMSGIHR